MIASALVQSIAIALLLWRREMPAFMLSLLAWLPVACTWCPESQRWTWRVWLPCAAAFSILQSMSAIEAVYRFGARYRLVVRLSITVGFFAIAAGLYEWVSIPPRESAIAQATEFVTSQRLASAVYLTLALALFASFLDSREFWARREGRHLLLLTVLVLTWAWPAIMPKEFSLYWWRSASDVVLWCRTAALLGWLVFVPDWTRRSAAPRSR